MSVEVAEQMLKNMKERAEECEGEGEGEERVRDMQQRQAQHATNQSGGIAGSALPRRTSADTSTKLVASSLPQQRHALTERCQQIQTATARTEHLGMMEERSLVAANSHDVEVVTSVDASLVLSVEGTVTSLEVTGGFCCFVTSICS